MSKIEEGISRRKFLKGGAAVVGAAILVPIALSIPGCIDGNVSPTPTRPPEFSSTTLPVPETGIYRWTRPSFNIEVPADWGLEFRLDDKAVIIRAIDSKKDTAYTSIRTMEKDYLKSLGRNIALQDLVNERIGVSNNSKSTIDDKIELGRAVENEGEWLIDNHSARRVDTTFYYEEDGMVSAKMVNYFFEDQATNSFWLIHFSAGSEKFDQEFRKFEEMLSSFHITENK